jgi:hypothetical protein
MSLYVYCLGDGLSEALVEGLAGVGGAPVRLLSLGRLAAFVSETEDDPVSVTDENVLAHNRVNVAALAGSTPLPFRFGARAERERLAEYAATNEAALVAALARVRGCVEMSVKIMEKTQGARRKTQEGDEAGRKTNGAGVVAAQVGRGTAFLLAKQRELSGAETLKTRAEEVAAWLAAGVSGVAREQAARVNPSEAIVVRAAHLVERARIEQYKERVRELSGKRVGLHFLTSGPWPPYSFSDPGQ